MLYIKRGHIKNGQIVFSEPLDLPEGTAVIAEIEPAGIGAALEAPEEQPRLDDDFTRLPFGMWAEREDLKNSVAWTRKERKRWSQRLKQQD